MKKGIFNTNHERYVIDEDVFGRQIIRPSYDGLLIISLVIIVLAIFLFPIFPLCFAIWALLSKSPRTKLYAAIISIFIFLYILFDIQQGWFIPYLFGSGNFFNDKGFYHGHLGKSEIPLIVVYLLNLAGLIISCFVLSSLSKSQKQAIPKEPISQNMAQNKIVPGISYTYTSTSTKTSAGPPKD